MTKLRKQRRRKTFQFNRNRKRVKKTRTNTGSVKILDVKQFWEESKTVQKNIHEMGLAADVNKTIGIPSTKKERLKIVKMVNGFIEEDLSSSSSSGPAAKDRSTTNDRPKNFVALKLEEDANEFREPQLRLPKGVVAELSYFLDKYQLNYKAMVRDRKNYNQYTWKQFRSKIRKFMSISEQFAEYLKSRNLSLNDLDWEECSDNDE